MNVYEPKHHPCEICKNKNVVSYPLCEDTEGKRFFYGVCADCRDKVPYKVIPIVTTMDEGFFYCPNIPADFKPVELDPESFNPRAGIVTRYGKKLLREGAKYYKKMTIGEVNDSQNTTSGAVDGDQGRG